MSISCWGIGKTSCFPCWNPSIIEGVQECVRMLLNKSIFKSSIFKYKLWCYSCVDGKIEHLQRL